ncbi:HNH endonuclease [Dactylosporangium sp. McL0621]|uniref:HNH endonuclease n=1 Tax=Dactylosporangium sp. McL0621 TaxID=3415678 RepID=UPI003CF55CF4
MRYDGVDDAVLRDVLHQAWRGRCHVCKRPKLFEDIEIDHLIPRSLPRTKLAELLHRLGRPVGFDVDQPANLAPICGSCNGDKGDQILPDLMLVIRLTRAERLEPRVIAAVERYATISKIGRNLRVAAAADLTDPAAAAAFEHHAPAIVQKLALHDETKADFEVARVVELDLGFDGVTVDLVLNARGRAAVAVLEDLIGTTLPETLEDATADLTRQISHRAADMLAGDVEDEIEEPIAVEVGECQWLRVVADDVDFGRDDDGAYVSFEGTFEGVYSVPAVRSTRDGDGLDDSTGDVEVTGQFRITPSWDLTAIPGRPHTATVEITDWRGGTVLVRPW